MNWSVQGNLITILEKRNRNFKKGGIHGRLNGNENLVKPRLEWNDRPR